MVIDNDCHLAEHSTKIRAVLMRCVPPFARVEVPVRRTGFQKSIGTPFRRVPAQFNHWSLRYLGIRLRHSCTQGTKGRYYGNQFWD